jgi:hypothetical protein
MEFLYLECRVRDVVGISDGLIKKTRREILAEGTDWLLVDRFVAYTAGAVGRVLDYLGGPLASARTRERAAVDIGMVLEASRREVAVPAGFGVVPQRVAVVVKKTRNRKIMLGRIDGIGPVRLQVRSDEHFCAGMEVPGCELVEADLWRYTGRTPRMKGRL